MPSLARELGSEALEADAFQTTACWWLSVAALVGVGLNGVLGWWWADPVAALVIALDRARGAGGLEGQGLLLKLRTERQVVPGSRENRRMPPRPPRRWAVPTAIPADAGPRGLRADQTVHACAPGVHPGGWRADPHPQDQAPLRRAEIPGPHRRDVPAPIEPARDRPPAPRTVGDGHGGTDRRRAVAQEVRDRRG